jgi:broad specificity phosphatase PhoE
MGAKNIYFVRHGETDANLHEYVPSREESLNEKGFLQADVFAQRVKNIEFLKIVTSDFLRAQQTAKTIASIKNITTEAIPVFGEVIEPSSLFGVSDTDPRVQAHRRDRNKNVEDPTWRQEDGENFTDVFSRIVEAKKFLMEDSSESIMVVSHSFFIQLFVAAILLKNEAPNNDWFSIAKTLKLSNTGITLFTVDEDVWKLIMWNDHAHFAE